MRLQLEQIFIFSILSLWKLQIVIATKVLMQWQNNKQKNNSFVAVHAMNISANVSKTSPI